MLKGRVAALYFHCLTHLPEAFAQFLITPWSVELIESCFCCVIPGKSSKLICIQVPDKYDDECLKTVAFGQLDADYADIGLFPPL